MIKQLFFTLLFSFYFSNLDAQYFNSIYNYMEAPEFEQDIHLLCRVKWMLILVLKLVPVLNYLNFCVISY